MIDFIIPLIGRFHPLIVHLPIGFIVFALLLLYYPKKDKNNFLPVIEIALLWSTVTAFLACISGVMHFTSEGYAFSSVRNHLILGWSTAFICALLYFQVRKHQNLGASKTRILSISLLISVVLTGHLGGSLTYGDQFLTEVLPEGIQKTFGWLDDEATEPLTLDENHWQDAVFYDEVIHPILQKNCRSCHNSKNTKGGLILTSRESLLIGGKNGKIIQSNQPEESTLLLRIMLPLEHEDHMPPKDKKQPKKEEVELLKAWFESGLSFEATLGQAGIPEKLVSPFFIKTTSYIYPQVELEPISDQVIQDIKIKGFFIEPLSMGSPLLKVSCLNFPEFNQEDFKLLEPVYSHIVHLDLGDTGIMDDAIEEIQKMKNLTILNLKGTQVSGINFDRLIHCENLIQLNLTGSQVPLSNLIKLNALPKIKKVFAFDTPAAGEITSKSDFTLDFDVEFGGFELPSIPSDHKVY